MGNFLDSSGLARVWSKIASTYLSKGGGTISNTIYGGQLEINRNQLNYDAMIKFSNKDDGLLGYIGICGSATTGGIGPRYVNASGSNYIIYHTGNLSPSSIGIKERKITLDGDNTTYYTFYSPYDSSVNINTNLVLQTVTTSGNTDKRPILLGESSSASEEPTFSTITGGVLATHTIYMQPSSGLIVSRSIIPNSTHTYNLGDGSHVYEYAYVRYLTTDTDYDLRLCTGGTERVHVNSSNGAVGIGTTSPTSGNMLDVIGACRLSGINFSSVGSFNINSYGNYQASVDSNSYYWEVRRADGSPGISVNGSYGNVGIGTQASTAVKLKISGTTNFIISSWSQVPAIYRTEAGGSAGIAFYSANQTSNCWVCGMDPTSSPYNSRFFWNYGAYLAWLDTSGNFYTTGSITAGSASDIRLKTNINKLDTPSAKHIVMNLKPVRFTWSEEATKLYDQYTGSDVGLIAQDVEPYLPQAIGSIYEKYKRLDYTKLITPLITVVQDHEERIKNLEKTASTNDYIEAGVKQSDEIMSTLNSIIKSYEAEIKELKERLEKLEKNDNN